MCQDGWMLDPTNKDGILNIDTTTAKGVIGGGVEVDEGGEGGVGIEGEGDDSGLSSSTTTTTFGDIGVYTGGTSTPTLSLRDVLHGFGSSDFLNTTTTSGDSGGGGGGYAKRLLSRAVTLVGDSVDRVWRSDATLALANEPDTLASGEAGEADRARRCNIGVMELRLGTYVVFTLRDVAAGEELLWDYGVDYDRSHYSTDETYY